MFSSTLKWWPSDRWPDNTPDTLLDTCLSTLVNTPNIFLDFDAETEMYSLKPGISLPVDICENLLARWGETSILDDKVLHMFKNTQRTRLKRLNLAESQVNDEALEWLMEHKPRELNIDMCEGLTSTALDIIHKHSDNLVALFVGNNTNLFMDLFAPDEGDGEHVELDHTLSRVFDYRRLHALSIQGLNAIDLFPAHNVITRTLHNLKSQLTYLDLSECDINFEPFIRGLGELRNLVTLVLYDVDIEPASGALAQIKKLTKLRALDLSQGRDYYMLYEQPDETLRQLVTSLPDLRYLDMSGTNLPGFIKPKEIKHSLKSKPVAETAECPIPGLEGRQFDFLGLLNCPYEACKRENLPAKLVAGDANEDQIILSVQQYTSKSDLLLISLNNLFQLCRYSECSNQRIALQALLEAMKKHPLHKRIQIAGSASLFYICKSSDKHNFSTKVKRVVLKTLLDGMDNHMDETTMLRNGCLTLCHFDIPQDVLFDYERVVSLLLQIVRPAGQEEFVQHVGIYLLNSLACQVDGHEKQLVGDLGAIETMLVIISRRLKRGICDEVMEIAWSTMWNVTDETPVNCERFITSDGMELFLKCLKRFPDKEELLRNMMGLMGNVAEVPYLRPQLMHAEYVSVFSDLLESNSDGIEVSYNACGVLAHMVSDGPGSWEADIPSRKTVLQRMIGAISHWKINTKRNINYRSFEPILRLLPQFHTPEAQHWAVWALCNLTKVYKKKYCDLVAKEQGLPLLEKLTLDPRPFSETKELASHVVRRCHLYCENSEYESDEDMEMDHLDDDDD